MPQDSYWANEAGLDLANKVMDRVKHFYRTLPGTLAWRRWIKGWAAFSGIPSVEHPFDVSELAFTGKEGELANFRTDDIGSLARHTVQMVTQTRPALDPVATNADYSSIAQTRAAAGVLEYIVVHEGLEQKFYRATAWAVATGQAWISAEWDPSWGDVYDVDPATGQPLKEGRFVSNVYAPWDVPVDMHRTDAEHEWVITRKLVNKWNLAAQYPAQADEILAVKDQTQEWLSVTVQRSSDNHLESDFIPVFTLFHDKTTAVPDGKWAVVLADHLLLAEGPLPYESLPLVQHRAGEILNTTHGDSPILHGLGIQDVLDDLVSGIATNNMNLVRQTIAVPKGAEWSRSELAEGMSAIEVDVGPDGQLTLPKAIQLVETAEETYKFVDLLTQMLGRVTGINSVVSGADPNLTKSLSGSALLLLEQQTLRYISGAQVSYTQMLEQIGTKLVQILKRYAKSPKLIRIAGKGQNYLLKEFSGRDFENFDRVEVQQGNPGMRTPAFRLQISQDLLERGLISTPEQYLEVLATGSLDSMTEGRTTSLFNIRRENEILSDGGTLRVMVTDPHIAHILEHRSVLDNPDARGNSPQAQQVQLVVTQHMQDHIDALRNTDPDLLRALGETPLPPPAPPGGMPPLSAGALPPPASSAAPGPGMQHPGGPPPQGPPPPHGGPPPPLPGGQSASGVGGARPPMLPQMPRDLQHGGHPPPASGSSGRH